MRGVALLAVALGGPLLGGTAAAGACETSGATFSDTFGPDRFSALWTAAGPFHQGDDGGLILAPEAGTSDVVLSQQTFGNVTICASIGVSSGPDSANTIAGVAFWGKDTENYYTLNVDVNGGVYADALENGKWKALASYGTLAAANAGAGSSNDLEVKTAAGRAEFFVNGTRVGSVAGAAPEGGQGIGVIAGTPADGPAEILARLITIAGDGPAQDVVKDEKPDADDQPAADSGTAAPQDSAPAVTAAYAPNERQSRLFEALLTADIEDPADYFYFYDARRAADETRRPAIAIEFDDDFDDDGYLDYVAFASEADAANYLAGDEASAFAKEVAAWAGGAVQYGRVRDAGGREFIWAGNASKDDDEQMIAMMSQQGDLVVEIWFDTYTNHDAVEPDALDDVVSAMGIGLDEVAKAGG
jgi:hypothetical protein